jgi:DNA-binding MarR family transcriptional regulator
MMSKATLAAGERRRRARSGGSPDERIQKLAANIAAGEKEPLRRRILTGLAEGPATPTQLSERFGSALPSVSRVLKSFREAGLVVREEDEVDHRNRHYTLTDAGEVELNRHVAFGEKQKPPSGPSKAKKVALLRKSLDKGVRIRRERNRLGEAASRFRSVMREAEKIDERELALEAMVELAKTVRQDRQPDERPELDASYDKLIGRLNKIAIGNARGYDADHALPAAAHLRYVLGRSGDRRADDLQIREAHLIAARQLYTQLYVNSSDAPAGRDWLARRAWSIVSHAGNLRKQTQMESALSTAIVAKREFDELEDNYGRTHCLFMFGLCLRLLGEFREAAVCLERAHEIATENSFERIRADALTQMGEVKRCLGEVDEAREMLDEAFEQAGQMDLWVTQAFARSALGAVQFQLGHFEGAGAELRSAEELFKACRHHEGMALNTRRQAAVARRIAEESSRPSYAAVERLARSAFDEYSRLHSPAGIAACGIEDGWVRMLRKGGRVQPVVSMLGAILTDRNQREFLELDPWVPQLLCRFARDAQDESLLEKSEEVLATAKEKLCERGSQGVAEVAEVIGDIELVDEEELDELAIEMGGEARRDPAAFTEKNQREHEFALAM